MENDGLGFSASISRPKLLPISMLRRARISIPGILGTSSITETTVRFVHSAHDVQFYLQEFAAMFGCVLMTNYCYLLLDLYCNAVGCHGNRDGCGVGE